MNGNKVRSRARGTTPKGREEVAAKEERAKKLLEEALATNRDPMRRRKLGRKAFKLAAEARILAEQRATETKEEEPESVKKVRFLKNGNGDPITFVMDLAESIAEESLSVMKSTTSSPGFCGSFTTLFNGGDDQMADSCWGSRWCADDTSTATCGTWSCASGLSTIEEGSCENSLEASQAKSSPTNSTSASKPRQSNSTSSTHRQKSWFETQRMRGHGDNSIKEEPVEESKEQLSSEKQYTSLALPPKKGPSAGVARGGNKDVWTSVKDPRSGRTYYFNRKTRKTSWTKPSAEDSKQPDLPFAVLSLDEQDFQSKQGNSCASLPEKPTKPAWASATVVSNGKKEVYYYNRITRQRMWTKPKRFDEDLAVYENAMKYYRRSLIKHKNGSGMLRKLRARRDDDESSMGEMEPSKAVVRLLLKNGNRTEAVRVHSSLANRLAEECASQSIEEEPKLLPFQSKWNEIEVTVLE